MISTLAPGTSRSWPSVTTRSPGLSPLVDDDVAVDGAPHFHGANLHGQVGLHHEDDLPFLARLNGLGGHQDGVGLAGELHHHVDEQPRPQALGLVGKGGLAQDGPRGFVHGVVDKAEDPHLGVVLLPGDDGLHRHLLRRHVLPDFRQVLFRDGKRHVDGLDLVDDQHGGIGVVLDHVALVGDQAAGAAADGGLDITITEIKPGVLHRHFIGVDRGAQGLGGGLGLVVILLADELFPDQLGVAPGVGLGLGGQGLIPGQVGFHLF